MATPTPAPPVVPDAAPHGADPMAQALALVQPWIDYVPPQQRRLGLFIFLALLAHLTAFFFIRIDTTRAELRHQLRPHVMVDSPQMTTVSGQQGGEGFWDQMNDPRLFLLPQQASTGASTGNPALSFTAISPSLGGSEMPPTAPPEGFQFVHPVNPPLDQRAGEAMDPPRQPFAYDENPPAIAPKTTWQWDAALASRLPTGAPELPAPVSDTDLSPTRMRVSVGPGGAVEHVLVEQSSGKADLDQLAALAVRKIRFQSTAPTGPVWGRVTVFWHYSGRPREEVVPTPPATP